MRAGADGTLRLTYCTNIHPGETWAEVRANLARYVVPVRDRLAGEAPFRGRSFGLGLRLSAAAADAPAGTDRSRCPS